MLPPSSEIKVRNVRANLDERVVARHDAVLVICPQNSDQKLLQRLPHASLWRKLQAQTHRDDGTPTLMSRVPNSKHTLMLIAFAKPGASTFACLTLAGKAVKEGKLTAYSRVLLTTVGFNEADTQKLVESLLAATLAAAAPLPDFKSKPARIAELSEVTLLGAASITRQDAAIATHAGNHLARWLTTLPPNHLNCASYAQTLKTLSRRMHWRYEFFGERELERLGAGAFLAVSRANELRNAGIVKISYRPKVKALSRIALVGKGICFDTGGINLKPHKSMYHMHEDMQGSAVAVGTLLALTDLQAPVEIDCWLALTENEIGPRAYRPQEVVKASNGVTIQVAHSDAEGRMVLADTLALASRENPETILDFATLTGACVGALTERMSGVFTNRRDWHSELERAGVDSGERVWNFPMDEDFDSDLDSHIADILQCTPDSKGDHILAARFLLKFVGKGIGWVHVDLAAGNRPGGLAHIPTDVTGFGVRFAVEWLTQQMKRDA